MSTIKVDTITTRTGSGNITASNTIAGNITGNVATSSVTTASGDLTVDVAGDIILDADGGDVFFKDGGTTIGGFTNNSGKLTLNSQGSNLSFAVGGTVELNTDGTQFYPETDNTHNLGISSNRFKDLYLSGGAFIGGTGTANKLDDYEVGTWTPTVNGLSGAASGYGTQIGHYTKIGNIVVAYFRFVLTNKGNISGNYALIQGLPFNHAGSDGGSGMVNRYSNLANAVSSLGVELGGSTPTAAWLTKQSGTSGTSDTYVTTADIQNNTFMQGSLIYRTG